MMKKLLALMLAALMLVSVVACNDTTANDTTAADDTTAAGEENNTPEGNSDITPDVEKDTMGAALWEAFKTAVEGNASITMEELANTLITNPVIQFMGGAMPLEKGTEFFTGFGEYKIEGFESAAVFMPMIGSIPFIGYIFELSEGQDAASFIKTLQDNANLRWYICVTADQMVAGSVGNKVFFLMCPETAAEDPGMAL